MAVRTLGTTAQTTLSAIRIGADVLDADWATIMNGIKDDKIGIAGSHLRLNQALVKSGQLVIPNRGIVQVFPGDYVAIDSDGWPILISASSIGYGSTNWVHT